MPQLFGRTAAVTVGTIRLVKLDFAFSVTKTLSREPNTAEIQIWNLSETSRQQIQQTENQRVRLEAGYEPAGGSSVIFEGDLRKVSSAREGVDIITTIEAADGERALRGRRVNRSFGPGTGLTSVVGGLADAIGIGRGNLDQVAGTLGFEGLGNTFSEGTVVSGNPREELSGLLDSAGVEWSVQDGNLQLLNRGVPLSATAVRLTAGTGLVESPSVDSEGVVKARSLLIPGIFPGRRVEILSEFVRGFFRVEKATYTGDTTVGANEWFVDIECKRPRTAA